MATELQQQRLRLDVGLAADDLDNLPDYAIDEVFVEAEETYTDTASVVAATRVITLRRLRMQAAAEVDYDQNNSSEKASQRFKHLGELLTEWQGYLSEAVAGARTSGARFGRTTRKPARVREYPNSHSWWW